MHKYDKSIGINFLDQPIERRLRAAKDAITPWQFNYILRGGWQNMKERYQAIRSYYNCDLLVATIAVFQILRLDHSVEFSYIALFFKDSAENKKQILLRFIEKSFIENYFSPLGLVWLCNGMIGYSVFYYVSEHFITEKMIVSALDKIININSSEERMRIAYFVENVFNLQYERNGKYYFYKYRDVFLDWIQNSDSETAYAYLELMNTLINTDIKQHRKFAREINWTCLQESMLKESKPNLYSWGKLYNRLVYSLPKKEYLSVGKMLENAIEKFFDSVSISNIEDLTCFFVLLCILIQIIFIKQWKN